MSVLRLMGVTRRFAGADRPAVAGVSLEVQAGEILAIIGESGCGKTTLLRLIAGLETPTRGEIRIDGRVVFDGVTAIPPERRGVGMVFQDYALFPHLTVRENIGFGLHRLSKRERRIQVGEQLRLVGLDGYGRRYPHELSGGQQQRVALARALAPRPALLLLDEPFSNMDAVLKQHMREEVHRILREAGTTALFVVHDCDDALVLADRIAILRDGEIQQEGVAHAVRAHPANEYVARFFGTLQPYPRRAIEGG